jgi:integrase
MGRIFRPTRPLLDSDGRPVIGPDGKVKRAPRTENWYIRVTTRTARRRTSAPGRHFSDRGAGLSAGAASREADERTLHSEAERGRAETGILRAGRVRRMLREAAGASAAAADVLLLDAWRSSEALALQIRQVNLDEGIVRLDPGPCDGPFTRGAHRPLLTDGFGTGSPID